MGPVRRRHPGPGLQEGIAHVVRLGAEAQDATELPILRDCFRDEHWLGVREHRREPAGDTERTTLPPRGVDVKHETAPELRPDYHARKEARATSARPRLQYDRPTATAL